MIEVQRIASRAGLAEIEAEWSALVERVPEATPFHRPQWLLPWWDQFGSGELHALAFRSESRLMGFTGMFLHEWAERRQVTLMGNGITDYLGPIAEPGLAGECARLTLEYLKAHLHEWDVCDWQDLRADAPVLHEPALGMKASVCAAEACTRAELPATSGEFDASLPHGLRRTIRIARRRLEREGELRFETVRNPDEGLLRELFRLHESRWAPRGGPGSMMDSPEVQAFLIAANREFSALGKVRLYAMRNRGELAAIIYGIFDRGRVWGYITGMDPALSRFSPGSLVLDHAMREAIGEGAAAWDFLRGEESYKFLWGARRVPKSRLLIAHEATASSSVVASTHPG